MPSRRAGTLSLEPGIEQHLQLDEFTGKFDVRDFVGVVSEKLISQSKASSGPFDPKPFIRSFEAAVDKLIVLRREVQSKTEQMEKSVRVSEREYSKKMNDLNRGFETVGNSFSGMQSRMSEVSSIAIRIGEQLESVHTERTRAQAAYDVIDFYNQLSRNDTSRLDAMRKEGRTGRRQVAVLLRRLNGVAKEVDLPTSDKTREYIERYCEKFEKEMLNLFDRSYRKGDPKMMHHCAQTLLEFNGGASCVQVYVNQHDFFINSVREADQTTDPALWDFVADPDANPPKNEKGLTDLFIEIRGTVDTEAQIVKAVFPNPPVVMQVFLQRVFAQSIQQHLEHLLHNAAAIADLAHLRVLQLAHLQTSALVEDLKAYEIPMGLRTPFESAELRRSLNASSGTGTITTTSISAMLETALEDLFLPYTEGQRYLERESRSLGTLYTSLLTAFTRYHDRAQQAKNSSVFNRVVNQLSAAAATTAASSSTSAQAATALLRFGGINQAQDKQEELIREEDGLLSVEYAEKMLKWHAEAIGRCVELSPSNDVPKHAFALLRVLSEAIANAYVECAIETAQVRTETADAKAEPDLHGLPVLRSVDLICHLWQQYVNTALLPLAASAVTIRREMVVFNNQAVSKLEGSVNQLLHRMVDAITSWLSLQLRQQKKTDFKPRNDDLSFARVNTEPCIACCDLLEKVKDAAMENLSGKNREFFFTEVGIAFHSLLLEHLRKYPVSATGGLMLAKDIKMYQDTIGSFGVPSLVERFEFIRELGNVFLVPPETLKSYIGENYLGRIDPSLLRPYLALRADWGQFEKGFGEDAWVEIPTPQTSIKRFARLSVMMKEFEGLKLEGMKLGEGLAMSWR